MIMTSFAKCQTGHARDFGTHLLDDGLGLGRGALHHVHHDDGAVAEPHGRRHLRAEVHVPRGVDQVDEVRLVRAGVLVA